MRLFGPLENVKKEIPLAEQLNYYQHNFECSNCNKPNWRKVPKGQLVKDCKVTCDNCGCQVKRP